ncbi:GNAT family N-acetyltransferase [Pontibacillus salicampi]|uniref:GNAT family N-acetyltransferase n=1 Tax=Pontibacillus salicampi TaxID=1449801 RepID=A0ABV6LIG8_9BACI
MDLNIQMANPADESFIANNLHLSVPQEHKHMSLEHLQELNQNIRDLGGHYLVAKKGEEIVGWIFIGKNLDYFDNKEYGYIYDLLVVPKHRGNQIGSALMKEAITYFRSKGYNEVRLNVFASNSAKQLYEKLGFQARQTIMSLPLEDS